MKSMLIILSLLISLSVFSQKECWCVYQMDGSGEPRGFVVDIGDTTAVDVGPCVDWSNNFGFFAYQEDGKRLVDVYSPTGDIRVPVQAIFFRNEDEWTWK